MGLKKLIAPIALASLFLISPTYFGRHDQHKYPRKDPLSPGSHFTTTFISYVEDLDNPRKGKDNRKYVESEWYYVCEGLEIVKIDENERPMTRDVTSPPPYKHKE